MLSKLPWSGSVHGFKGEANIIDLQKYMTTAWLASLHEDQMLELLDKDIRNNARRMDVIITYSDFLHGLKRAFSRRKQTPKGSFYKNGSALASGISNCLATIANHEGNHWTAVVVDFPSHIIWHGDSLAWDMEPELKSALEWWISEHTSIVFTHANLPITHQEDFFSCGLLPWNALSHHFLPEQHPLIDPADVAAERLKVFLCVCKRHLDEVSLFLNGSRMPHSHDSSVRGLPIFLGPPYACQFPPILLRSF
jgi:hypothetical protein